MPVADFGMLGPGIKTATQSLGFDKHRRQAPVTSGQDTFQPTLVTGIPFNLNIFVFKQIFYQMQSFLAFRPGKLTFPLKRRVRFRNKGIDADMQTSLGIQFFGNG